MKKYTTLSEESFGVYEEKHSKFYSAAVPCSTEKEISEYLSAVRSKYWDARHHVYAYKLKDGSSRFSDDGEPHGTAGKPVFDVLDGSGLKDVLIVVTRYFGGTLLGTGGLVRAYSTAAKDSLETAVKVNMCPATEFSLICQYTDYQKLIKLLEEQNAAITDTVYTENVALKFLLLTENIEIFKSALTEAFSAKLTAEEGTNAYYPLILK